MSAPTLEDAVRALDARKEALGVDPERLGTLDGRHLLVGLDLNPDELNALAERVGEAAVGFLPIVGPAAIGGVWVDGVTTGLLLAELRAAHDRPPDDPDAPPPPIADPRVALSRRVRRALERRAREALIVADGRCTVEAAAAIVVDAVTEELVRQGRPR